MEFYNCTLDNGLEIIAECDNNAYSTAMGFYVKAGARDESDDVSGVSHFLEHMVFKGTDALSADDVNRRFDELGAAYNAFTSEECTGFYAVVLPENLEETLALYASILRPALREDDFEMEKQVILEEIRMYDDQPPYGADDKCRAAFFGTHPMGRSVLGTERSIRQLCVDAMRGYFKSRYGAENIVLVAVGKVDFEQLVALAQRHCGDWFASEAKREILPIKPSRGFQVLQKPSSVQQYVVQMSPGPQPTLQNDRELTALLIAGSVLGDSSGSRLFWELVDPGLAESAGVAFYEAIDTSFFYSGLVCSPELAEENLGRMQRVLHEALEEGLTEEEVTTAKRRGRARMVLGHERPSGRLYPIAAEWLATRRYFTLEEELELFASITTDLTNEMMRAYPPTAMMTTTIGPLKTFSRRES